MLFLILPWSGFCKYNMEALTDLLSARYLGVAVVVYFLVLALYRLTLHPLARFPGPKLAAISRYYEAYYDVVQNGQYTFKIKQLHKQYGKARVRKPAERY
jgi:hypothetical protein